MTYGVVNICTFTESGNLSRGVLTDESNTTNNKSISQISELHGTEIAPNFRSVNSPLPCLPLSFPLPGTQLSQSSHGPLGRQIAHMHNSDYPAGVLDQHEIRQRNPYNPFTLNTEHIYDNENNGSSKGQQFMHANTLHPNYSQNWKDMTSRRTNSNEDLSFGSDNSRHQHHEV